MSHPLEVIILAAGQGTRMKSLIPKVLHTLAGKPLLAHVLDTAKALSADKVHVVYGHGGDKVRNTLSDAGSGSGSSYEANWVEQAEQLGTGHAVEQAMAGVSDEATVLVLYGDVPLVKAETLDGLISAAKDGALAILTVMLENPKGYGRIIRNEHGSVQCIVEEKDASEAQKSIQEGNSGMLATSASKLHAWLRKLESNNAQGEFYLTDIIALAVAEGVNVEAIVTDNSDEVLGVNNRSQLAHLERVYQQTKTESLMEQGVTFNDPARFDLRGELDVGQDIYIDNNVIIEGKVKLGDRVVIGANCILRDVVVEDDTVISPMSIIEQAQIGRGCDIGPFARIRPGTKLSENSKIGNFVEIKNSDIGYGSKVNHLSYIGDTTMGENVNIGAGTITCNYDGANKHRTIIEDDCFIGSDSQLVAPVKVSKGATIGAGSTITSDVPADDLTLSRSKQRTYSGWKRPAKKS